MLPRLIESEPDVFLLFAGPDAGKFRRFASWGRVFAADYYKGLGPLQGKETHRAFECAKFLALPSDEDPYPLVLLESDGTWKARA